MLENRMRSLPLTLLLAILSLCSTDPVDGQVQRPLLVRIDGVSPDALLKTGIVNFDEYEMRSVLSLVRDTALVLLTPTETALLRERGFHTTIVMEDTSELRLVQRAAYGPGFRMEPPYHSYTSIVRELDSLQRAYPSLIRVMNIGASLQNRIMVAVKIAKDVGKEYDRPAILFDGCHHSNEVMGAEICMAAVNELLSRYGQDVEVTRWIDQYAIYVVPVVNVDGYTIVTSGQDPRWRKNARDTDGKPGLHFPEGVDLNRTYDFNWAHGGSSDSMSGRYRGPFPFSEPETRAFADFARQKRFLLSITYHSQGEVIYYPWNWNGHKAPDDRLLTSIAQGLGRSIKTMRSDSTYRAEYGAGLVGQSYTWLYGALGTFDFVVETGKGASIFPPYEVAGIVRENLNGVRFMLRQAEGPGLHVRVKDARTGAPLEAQVWFPAIETEEVHRRTTQPAFGSYRRLLLPGKYVCIISRHGYRTAVLDDIAIGEAGWIVREIALEKL
jgi:hypothetical protein